MPEFARGNVSLLACAVFDVKVKCFLNPIFVRTRGEAVRSFTDAVRREDSPFHKHPEDYSLHLLGEFDEENGVFTNCVPAPEQLVLALSLVSDERLDLQSRAALAR